MLKYSHGGIGASVFGPLTLDRLLFHTGGFMFRVFARPVFTPLD